jgi:hypothetical protein
VTQVKQEVEDAPSRFLRRLREALIKHNNFNPDTYEEQQLILIDKFITQSAPDICRRILKSPKVPEDTLNNLLNWLLRCSTLGRRRNYRFRGLNRGKSRGSSGSHD